MTVREWIAQANEELQNADISSHALDAELLLAHTIRRPRTWLHAHSEDMLDARHVDIANARLDLRKEYVPVAYIIGHKEFYGRRFTVSPDVLIPRPESEQIIELLNDVYSNTLPLDIDITRRLVDVGTGSGCLGITAKLEHPELEVTLTDISKSALLVAEKNARVHAADVTTAESNLLDSYPFSPDIVLANLPYVDESWERSPETNHEPSQALFAKNNGLKLIERLFDELSHRQNKDGVAIFEADPRQWNKIDAIASKSGYTVIASRHFAKSYRKV